MKKEKDNHLFPVSQYHDSGYINKNGKQVMGGCLATQEFREGLAPVLTESGWSYIRPDGSVAIDGGYIFANGFSEGLATVGIEDDLSTIIDQGGQQQIFSLCSYVGPCRDGIVSYILAGDQNIHGYMSKTGKILAQWNTHPTAGLRNFSEGLVAIHTSKGYWSYCDSDFEELPLGRYDHALEFSEGLGCVRNNHGKWGAINKDGDQVLPFVFDELSPASSGVLGARVGKSWGFLNADGSWRIEPDPDWVRVDQFQDGLCAVAALLPYDTNWWRTPAYRRREQLWGYIDLEGNWAVDPAFVAANAFSDGLARVKVEKEHCQYDAYIDAEGELVWLQKGGVQ